jgi:hypothetical protein
MTRRDDLWVLNPVDEGLNDLTASSRNGGVSNIRQPQVEGWHALLLWIER